MFAMYQDSSFSVDSLCIWFEDEVERALRPWLVFRRDNREQKLLPVLKDIIGTQFPFINPDRLSNKSLYSVEVGDLTVTLVYLREDGWTDTESDVQITIDIDDILNALKVDNLDIGLYLYGSSEAGSGGDDELMESYDFTISRDAPPKVAITTDNIEEDLIIGGNDDFNHDDRA